MIEPKTSIARDNTVTVSFNLGAVEQETLTDGTARWFHSSTPHSEQGPQTMLGFGYGSKGAAADAAAGQLLEAIAAALNLAEGALAVNTQASPAAVETPATVPNGKTKASASA